jgi:hypothetical protein
MIPLINTIKHLLLSKDVNNIILASELARTCPAIIDITYFEVHKYGNITIIRRPRRSARSWGDGIMMGNGNGNGTGHSHKYGDGEGSGYGNNE